MPIKKIAYYISLAALFVIPAFPLIVANSLFFPFITGKALYFRFLVEIAFAAWLILAFLDARYRPKLKPLSVAVCLFALVTLVADLLGVNPMRSLWSNFERMEGWITIIHLSAFYIVAASIFGSNHEDKRLWHRWLNVALFVGLIVAIYGLFQLFGLAAIHQSSSRLDASLGNSAYMAVYMLFQVFIAAYMFFVARGKRIGNYAFLQFAYPILAILYCFIIFETQTRGTILGLLGGIMLALFLYAVFGKGQAEKWRLTSAGILVFIILVGAVFWLNRGAAFIQRDPVLGRLATISWSDASNQARQYIWPMALKGVAIRPIFGWGQENFNYIFNADYDPAMYAQEQWFDRAHSVFLDWLVASGFVGLLSYLSLYVLFLLALWKSSLSVAEKSVLTGLLAGYAIHNVFVFDNLASYALFFAVLAFASSLQKGRETSLFGTKPVRTDVVEYIGAPIVVIALVFAVYFYNVRTLRANRDLILALSACSSAPDTALFEKALGVHASVADQEIREQLMSCTGRVVGNQRAPVGLKQSFFALTMNEVQAQASSTPLDTRIYALAGSLLNGAGQFVTALPYLEKAHLLSPGKQTIDFELGTAYLNTGKTDDALALLKGAYESAPAYYQAKASYATALVLSGKEAEARKIFNNDPAIFETDLMGQVYANLKQYDKALPIFKKLAATQPTDVNAQAQYAQVQYAAGMVTQAIATMRGVEKDHPELTASIEAAIKDVQSQANK
ncbi:MAG: hypothetical protein QOG91_162 [Candidatus Parcubacteria bacterium]|jgi:O-antigen ligase/Flp pilus assembly protein TadD|nr:hypothetical protein [Candidatus Parcubacteria bacterium]